MLFITNRFPDASIRSSAGRRFEFDLKNNAPSNSVFFCERDSNGAIVELGHEDFLNSLRAADYRQILLYIHGFSNLPEDVFRAATEFQLLCDKSSRRAKKGEPKNEVLVVPVIWPCDDGIGIVQNYWDDQKSADYSAISLPAP